MYICMVKMTGSLASLAKEQQERNKVEGYEGLDIKKIINKALEFKEKKISLATIYIDDNVKRDLERVRSIKEYSKISLASFASAIIKSFIDENREEIKNKLLKEIENI